MNALCGWTNFLFICHEHGWTSTLSNSSASCSSISTKIGGFGLVLEQMISFLIESERAVEMTWTYLWSVDKHRR